MTMFESVARSLVSYVDADAGCEGVINRNG